MYVIYGLKYLRMVMQIAVIRTARPVSHTAAQVNQNFWALTNSSSMVFLLGWGPAGDFIDADVIISLRLSHGGSPQRPASIDPNI